MEGHRVDMNGTNSNSPVSTFVLRIWHERATGRTRWRGRAEHVQSGESVALQSEQALLDFIRRFGALPAEEDAHDKSRSTGGRP